MQAPDAGDGLDVDLLGRQYNNAAGARDEKKTSAGVLYISMSLHISSAVLASRPRRGGEREGLPLRGHGGVNGLP